MMFFLFMLTQLFIWTSNAVAFHHAQSVANEYLPDEILQFCEVNKKRFYVTSTMDRDNEEVIIIYTYVYKLL